MLSAPSLRIASPCSKFAARFPRARAASLETRGEEDPSAFINGFSRTWESLVWCATEDQIEWKQEDAVEVVLPVYIASTNRQDQHSESRAVIFTARLHTCQAGVQ